MQKIKQDISLGDNIRKYRKMAGMTQESVVAQLQLSGSDISRSIYSQIECGTYNIRVSELIRLSALFDVEIGLFFENISTQ